MKNPVLALLAVLLVPSLAAASSWAPAPFPEHAVPQIHPLPPLRQQAEEQQAWLAKRLTDVLPRLMREHGVEMWILSMREYAEDPVFFS
ncbi:MAG TPA: Xaa-Pro aminopeptidase, partial [Thermoanaerobaculia bacterium]|nr:Xaa-Pro aminopeptidase [Thermoanaerobaculia bacterium]